MPPAMERKERPRSGDSQRLGDERYRLLRDAFSHAQLAFRVGHYIETISVLESILADRLGSLLYGITRQRVELQDTIGNLLHYWENPAKRRTKVASSGASSPSPRELPRDIAGFLKSD